MRPLVWWIGLLVVILGGCLRAEPDWRWRNGQADAIREAAFRHYLEDYLSRQHLGRFRAEAPIYLAVGAGAPSDKVMRGVHDLGPGVKSVADRPPGREDPMKPTSLGIVRITAIKWFDGDEVEADLYREYGGSSTTQYSCSVARENRRWVVKAMRPLWSS
jgi:hypothetical protein